jgi:hypothetical protein
MPRFLLETTLVAALVWASPASVVAKPDFSRSRISISPSALVEGDVVTFTVEVVNSGDQDAPFADVVFELPLEAMFVSVDGFEDVRVNAHEKVLGGTMALAAGATRPFRVRMVIPRDASGHILTADLSVRYLHQGVEFYAHETYEIATRVAESGVLVGPVRVSMAGLVVLGFIAAFPVLWLTLRLLLPPGRVYNESGVMRGRASRLVGPATAAFAILLPLAFWIVFGTMAVRDWQSYSWPRTSCLITDSRLREEQNTSSSTVASGGLRRTRTTTTRSFQPLLALRYDADGKELISTGFDTGSFLRVGGRARAESDLTSWPIEATVPCWYNPTDQHDVVVRNGFGGAYLFALFPLPIALFGFYRTRALLRGR